MSTSMNTNESNTASSRHRKARNAPSSLALRKEWQARTMSMLSLLTEDGQESDEMVQAKLALYAEFFPRLDEAIRSALGSANAKRGNTSHRELVRIVMLALLVINAATSDISTWLDDADVDNAQELCAALDDFSFKFHLHGDKVERALIGAVSVRS